jgi:hypothetical protein
MASMASPTTSRAPPVTLPSTVTSQTRSFPPAASSTVRAPAFRRDSSGAPSTITPALIELSTTIASPVGT